MDQWKLERRQKTRQAIQKMSLQELYAARKFTLIDMQIVSEKMFGIHLDSDTLEKAIYEQEGNEVERMLLGEDEQPT